MRIATANDIIDASAVALGLRRADLLNTRLLAPEVVIGRTAVFGLLDEQTNLTPGEQALAAGVQKNTTEAARHRLRDSPSVILLAAAELIRQELGRRDIAVIRRRPSAKHCAFVVCSLAGVNHAQAFGRFGTNPVVAHQAARWATFMLAARLGRCTDAGIGDALGLGETTVSQDRRKGQRRSCAAGLLARSHLSAATAAMLPVMTAADLGGANKHAWLPLHTGPRRGIGRVQTEHSHPSDAYEAKTARRKNSTQRRRGAAA